MSNEIRLREYDKQTVTLAPDEVALIRRELKSAVTIWPTYEPGRYEVRTGSHVGFVTLPGGRTLVIEPKVTIETLFALLAAVYDPSREFLREDPQAYTDVTALFEFVVRIFVVQVEDLVARGVLHGYRSVVDDLVAVRGRLLLAETLHRRPALRDRHSCSYSHFTPDVDENRILRWTAFCLQPYRYEETNLAGRLRRVGGALSRVTLDPEARELFERLSFHRLNDPYRPALALARLLLDHLTFSGTAGEEPFLAYLVDMNVLFERYVGAVLRRTAHQWGVQVLEQRQRYLDIGQQVQVKPDVILIRQDTPLLVLDAKYKLAAAQGDIYQMLAYCHALGLREGVVVHPAHEGAPSGVMAIRGPGEVQVRYLTLDLRGGPADLERQSLDFVARVESIVDLGSAVQKQRASAS